MITKLNSLHDSKKAAIAAVILSMSFASMGIWIRMSADSFDNFQQSYLRVFGASIIALVFFRRYFVKDLFRSLSKREWSIYGLRACMGYIFGVGVFTFAVNNADIGVVACLGAVPLLGLLAFVMFRERLPLATLPFLALSIVGIFLVTGANLEGLHFGIGELAAIFANVGFAISFLMSRMHDKRRNNYESTTILLLIGWIPLLALSLLTRENIIPESVSLAAIVGLTMGAILNVTNLFATNYIFSHMRAYAAGNILLLETVWGALFGLALFGEPLTFALLSGGALIVACALAINWIDNGIDEAPQV